MSFLSLYRKYRPGKFSDLVGQEHVVRTLKNAITGQRIAHAYLFAGPRGTGKTSTAKVFAQALNCERDQGIEPCGQCQVCTQIRTGQSIDVIEIDAASNRGIDEIRELREKVKFYPSQGSYKVYIIDEVHMLTTGAFNALLKTLEEPPENVVFILATTEPHKVISTILSRCQRFDFSLLSLGDIKQRLQYICEQEDVETTDDALTLIADSSNGGMRDAISLLDQAITFTNGDLTAPQIEEMLGKIDEKVLSQFIELTVEQQTDQALRLVNDIIEQGKSVARFIEDMIEHCRQLMIVSECGIDAGLLEYSESRLQSLTRESQQIDRQQLMEMIELFTGIEQEIRYSSQPRLNLEVGVVRLTSPESESSLEGLSQRVSRLEARLADGFQAETVSDSGLESDSDSPQVTSGDLKNRPAPQQDRQQVPGTGVKQETQPEEQVEGKSNNMDSNQSGDESVLTLEKVRKSWPLILREVKQEHIKTHAFLIEGKPVAVKDGVVFVEFPRDKSFHKKGAAGKKDMINRVMNQVLENAVQVRLIIEGSDPEMTGSEEKNQDAADSGDSTSLSEEELAREVADLFDGEIIEANQDILEN